MIFQKVNLLFIFLLLGGCDFTPTYHKEILRGQDYVKAQDYEKAVIQYKGLLQKTISNEIKLKIYFQLGEIYSIHLGKLKESLEYYKRVTEISDDLFWIVKAQEKIGNLCFSFLKDFECSKTSYDKLYSFVPKLNNHELYQFRLAISHFRIGDFEKSKELLKEINSIKNGEYRVKSFYYLGLVGYISKNWKEAITYWKSYIGLEKRRDHVVKTIFLMANAYETMEELKNAYNLYYSILGEYPNMEVVQNRLNALYNRRIARKR